MCNPAVCRLFFSFLFHIPMTSFAISLFKQKQVSVARTIFELAQGRSVSTNTTHSKVIFFNRLTFPLAATSVHPQKIYIFLPF